MATNSELPSLPMIRTSTPMRWNTGSASIPRNVCFGLLDYIVQPLLMLGSARYFVRHLGIAQFGIWMLVLTVIGSSGSLCTGFGDAALKYVSMMRGRFDTEGVRDVIRKSLVLNLTFGFVVAVLLFVLAPWASAHVFNLNSRTATIFVLALRVGSVVLLLRSLSFVFNSSLRAFECYRDATQITSTARVGIVILSIVLVMHGRGVVAILAGTAIIELVALVALVFAATKLIGPLRLFSGSQRQNYAVLANFGVFSWLQALCGTVFSQADRLLVGAMLGPAALGYYSVCVQAGQPIHGLAASASNVLFPYLSARTEKEEPATLALFLSKSLRLNAVAVTFLFLPLAFLSKPILTHWMGPDFAAHSAATLPIVALSFVFLALNIPGHYALMALGRVRYLTLLNFLGSTLSLIVALALIPRFGIMGAAIARLAYGPVTWVAYSRLASLLRAREERAAWNLA